MKTSKLINVAWVFFALVLTTTTVFAQRGRRANTVQNNQNLPCLTQISNLTEEQETSIQELEASHQKTMDELREKRRSTVNAVEKSEIRTEMLKSVEAHRNEVKSLLTEEQQVQYRQLQTYGGYGWNQNMRQGRGNFQGRGNVRGNFCEAGMHENGYAQAGFRGSKCNNIQATNFRNNKKVWNQGRGNARFNRYHNNEQLQNSDSGTETEQ